MVRVERRRVGWSRRIQRRLCTLDTLICFVVFVVAASILVSWSMWQLFIKQLQQSTVPVQASVHDVHITDKAHLFENSCKFIWVEDEEPSMKDYIEHGMKADCKRGTEIFDRQVDGSFKWRRTHKGIRCVAAELKGGLRDQKEASESGKRDMIPHGPFYVNADVFRITCFDASGEGIRAITYAGVKDSRIEKLVIKALGRPKKPKSPAAFDIRNMSISILALDSTARAQFHRHMKKSVAEMRRMGFTIFHGYNKVGDNSNVNLLPILAEQLAEGLNFSQFDDGGDINIDRILPSKVIINPDSIRFLWKEMREKGCVTMFNDDIMHTSRGLFHYPGESFMKGFKNPPTDHYYRAYYYQVFKDMANYGKDCYHGELTYGQFLDIWFRFHMKYLDRCSFSFSFMTSLTHDRPNDIELLDDLLSDRLIRLEESGALQNTVLIIMGDHGNRITVSSRTFAGRIEERQPLLAILLPKGFVEDHPKSMRNFLKNTQRFISNFDLHETLTDLIRGEIATNRSDSRGVSLFKPIPKTRSCRENNVVHNFCLCMKQDTKTPKIDLSEMALTLDDYLSEYECIVPESVKCGREVDFRVPNEMVRARMRDKYTVPAGENIREESPFVYLYQNCTMQSEDGAELDVVVQFRFDRDGSYDIVYPPMVIPRFGACTRMRNTAAYCKCVNSYENKR
ncbi:hypothetical protein Q1695_002955 [Nippostrongylus brasiliensis]|nr:hypothetical protein Q1695_002955 [Nippostrongylus brasiliensis]